MTGPVRAASSANSPESLTERRRGGGTPVARVRPVLSLLRALTDAKINPPNTSICDIKREKEKRDE